LIDRSEARLVEEAESELESGSREGKLREVLTVKNLLWKAQVWEAEKENEARLYE
jgi:hypothetical protein